MVFLVSYLLWAAISGLALATLFQPPFLIEIHFVMVILNSAINPVAYDFYKGEIKKELEKLFRCKENLGNESGASGRQGEIHELRPFRKKYHQQFKGSLHDDMITPNKWT